MVSSTPCLLTKIITLTLLLALGFSPYVFSQSDIAKPQLRVGGLPDRPTPPYMWLDTCSNELTGVLRAVVEEALEDEYELIFLPLIETTPTSWTETVEHLKQGKYDIQIAMYSPPPQGILISHSPVALHRTSIFTKKNRYTETIQLDFLKDKKGIMLQGGKGAREHRQLLQLQAKGFNINHIANLENTLSLLIKEDIDYIIGEHFFTVDAINRLKLKADIQITDYSEKLRGIYAGVSETGEYTEVIPLLDVRLKAMNNSGAINLLTQNYLKKWLTKSDCQR